MKVWNPDTDNTDYAQYHLYTEDHGYYSEASTSWKPLYLYDGCGTEYTDSIPAANDVTINSFLDVTSAEIATSVEQAPTLPSVSLPAMQWSTVTLYIGLALVAALTLRRRICA